MAHTALLARPVSIKVAPRCLREDEFWQGCLREFLWLEMLHSRRKNRSANVVYMPAHIRTLGMPKISYVRLIGATWVAAVAMSVVLLVDLIVASSSLLSNFTLPVEVGAILLPIFIGVSICLLLAKQKREENMKSKVRRKDSGREVVRFQFEIDPDLWKELERFQHEAGLTTKRELLNNALTLFRWAAQHKERGNSIHATGPNGTIYELEMPVLESIELNSQRKIRLVDAEDSDSATTASAA